MYILEGINKLGELQSIRFSRWDKYTTEVTADKVAKQAGIISYVWYKI